MSEQVVDLGEYRSRDLNERQRQVLERVQSGEAECGLCGDLGAVEAGNPVPCLACGKKGVNETRSLPDAGYWLYARGVAVPPGHHKWGYCELCVTKAAPCFSCQMRADAEAQLIVLRSGQTAEPAEEKGEAPISRNPLRAGGEGER